MFKDGKNDYFDHLENKVDGTPEDLVDNECSDDERNMNEKVDKKEFLNHLDITWNVA